MMTTEDMDPDGMPTDDGLVRKPEDVRALARSVPDILGGERLTEAEAEDLIRRLSSRRSRRRRTVLPEMTRSRPFSVEQRLFLLDTWLRSKLPAKDFAAMVGLSKHTLYKWKHDFEQEGPAGLRDSKKGRARGSRLTDPMKRAILMLKQAHPDRGQERMADVLCRESGFSTSPGTIGRYLLEEG